METRMLSIPGVPVCFFDMLDAMRTCGILKQGTSRPDLVKALLQKLYDEYAPLLHQAGALEAVEIVEPAERLEWEWFKDELQKRKGGQK